MRLDYKKTIKVGIAFFIITIFWTTYDTVIARILIDKFGLNQVQSGVVMALDNILAVFLLPIFGALSDRSHAKRGKRTAFIWIGTIVAAIAFMGLTVADNMQSKNIEDNNPAIVALYDDAFKQDKDIVRSYEHWQEIQTKYSLLDSEGHPLLDSIIKDETGQMDERTYSEIKEIVYDHLNKEAYQTVTKKNALPLVIFGLTLLVGLLAMSVFRSPAVALMPDVTIKPLRSKANAIINLMGSFSALVALVLLLVTKRDVLSYVSYSVIFISIGVMMLVALALFLFFVKEKQWVEEKVALDMKLGLKEEEEETEHHSQLSHDKKVSLFFILFSVFFWFMGYNAVISKVADYAPKVLNMGSSLATIIAHATAVIAFIPIGIISSKIGRKKAIITGIIILFISFGSVFFITESTGAFMYLIFGLVGIGWATINVNSYPMVVELAKGSDVGKYTGYYYTFSMAAQIITPVFSGFLMLHFGREVLFPYASLFVAVSLITMLFVKHGNSGVIEKKSLLENFDVE